MNQPSGHSARQSKLLAAVISLEPIARFVKDRRFHNSRRLSNRLRLANAVFAKAIYNLPTTRHLIERLQSDTPPRRLCGWDTAAQKTNLVVALITSKAPAKLWPI